MMNFEFKCPQCGQMVEADEAYRGQVAECPHCGKGIVIPCNRTKGVIGRKRSFIHQQDHHDSTAESAMASTLLGTESPLQPTVISDKWVWCLSVIPIVAYWTLCILVHSFVGLLVAWILNVIFVILDFKEVDRSGQDVSKALYLWGLFFVPGYLFYRAVKYSKGYTPAIIWCVLFVLPMVAAAMLQRYTTLHIVEQPSIQESFESISEDGDVPPTSTENAIPIPVIKNSDGTYDWQSMCQKEWPKSFSEIQKAFSVLGGFQLAQRPIDGFEVEQRPIDGFEVGHGYKKYWLIQENVPLQKPYRYFQKADLKFYNGALVGFTLKVHFEKKYSMASIDREHKALQEDVVENLKHLNKPELGLNCTVNNHILTVAYGLSPNISVHEISGLIYTDCRVRQDDDGHDLMLSVDAYDSHDSASPPCKGIRDFITLVIEKEAYEDGEELEGFNKKEKSWDDSTKELQSCNRATESAERKSEGVETRSAKTDTPTPLPTIPEPTEKEVSPNQSNESADPQPQAVAQPNPHFEAAKKHDWQRLCQKEWSRSFLEIQGAFSVFGGFKLAQAPIDGIEFDSEDIQKDVPLQKKYRYFKTADLEFFNGALVGFTLKAHFAKNYSKASVERECKAFEDDVVMNLSRLKRPALGIGFGGYCPWHIEYGQSRNPSVHKIIGMIIVSYDLRQDDDGYDLTLSVDAQRGMRHFIELTLKNETDEAGDELEVFDKKQQAGGKDLHRDEGGKSPAERMNKTVKIAGFGSYKFGQKYSATRMTAEMWQEGGLAIKPVQIRYRKFKTLELGYAIDGKQLCRLKLCAEFSPDADNKQLSDELMDVKGELERQLGFEMTGSNNEVIYEDEKYAVKLWYQPTTKTVYKTKHVGFRNQRITNTVNIKGLYLLLEDKRLMPK